MLLENTFEAGKVVLEERLLENYFLERVISYSLFVRCFNPDKMG